MTGFCERLIERNRAALRPFEEHRFFREAAAGTLPPDVRDAYFRYEKRYVDQAVVVVAHTLTKAPTLDSSRHLQSMLKGLLYDQQESFSRIFEALDLSPVEESPKKVAEFCEGMTDIAAEGSYAQGIAAMLVAERTYALVAREMAATPPPDPMLRLWFDLHAAPDFQQSAKWLCEELDRFGRADDGRGALDVTVKRVAQLEVAFHDAAWIDTQ